MALRDVQAVVTITTNATKAIDDGKKLRETYKATLDIIKQFRTDGKIDTPEGKELLKLADDLQAKIKALVTGMDLIRGVADNLANKTGKDVNRAMREISKEFNKTANETDADKQKLQELSNTLAKLKEDKSIRQGLTMPLKEAQQQINNLVNTPLDKLRMGLAAINKEIEHTFDATKRAQLQTQAQQYRAQIAVNEQGPVGNANIPGVFRDDAMNMSSKDRQQALMQMQAEQQRLRSIFTATDGAKGFEVVNQDALDRLHQVNQAVTNLTEAERHYAQEKQKSQTAFDNSNKALDVTQRLQQGQKVTLQELIETQKHYNAELQKFRGVNLSPGDEQIADALKTLLEQVETAMRDITGIDLNKVFANLDDQPLEKLEQALKQVKEQAAQIKVGDETQITQTAKQIEVLEAKIAEAKQKLGEGIADALDFDNLQDVPTEKLEQALKQLEQQEKRLIGTDTAGAQKMAENKRKVQEQINRNRRAVQDYANAEKVAANTGKHNVTELKAAYEALQQKLMGLNTGQKKEIAEVRQQMKQVKQAIDETTGSIAKQGSVWSTAVKNITAYVGVFGAFNFVKSKLQEVIRGGEELSDQMAQIRMVSGLTMNDIEELTRRMAKMDTRTTLQELGQIAYAGAKLGFGEQGIQGLEEFTRAANQVNVALREDLGEEALTALSKITENMGLIKKMGVEDAMLATSSAMFKLAATSTAAAGPIVEVTKRLAPVAQMSGFATHEILALASASDSLQLMPEVVGTALSKLIMAMQNNHNLIEKYLTIPEGTIASMFKAGQSMDALMLVFEKMSGKNVTELDGLWKLLGSDGQRLITVVADMANHTDTLAKHLDTSTKAFKEATAVTEEYNIQQETAMAYLLRAENLWRNAFINPDSSLSVKEMTKAWYDFTKSILSSDVAMSGIKLSIDALLLSIRLLIAILPAITFGLLAKGAMMLVDRLKLAKIATDGFALSWKKMDAATKSNWIGLIVGGLVQLVYWTKEWISSSSDAEKEQKKLSAAIENMHEKQDQEIGNLKRLKKQLDDTNISQDERNALLQKVRTDYDIYLNYLGIEKNAVTDLTKHYDALVKVMRQRFAYQEREDYKRDVMGGEDGLRMKRRQAGSDLDKAAKDLGIKDINKDLIDQYVKKGLSASAIRDILFPQTKDNTPVAAYVNPWATSIRNPTRSKKADKLWDKLVTYVTAKSNENSKEKEIDDAFASEIGDFDYDKWLRTQVTGDFKLVPDKEALKAAKKEQQERKKELKLELDQAKENADGLIAKIDEWYNLQEAAVKDAEAMGQMSKQSAEDLVKMMEIARNQSLAKARKAVGSGEQQAIDDWQTWAKTVMPKMMADSSKWSTELFDAIVNVDVKALYDFLKRFDGSKAMAELDASSFLDTIMKKGSGSLKKAQVLRAQFKERTDKYVEQYQVIDTAQRKMQDDLQALGWMTETYEEMAQRIAENREKGDNLIAPSQQRVERTATAFTNQQGREQYSDSPQDMGRWLTDLSSQKGAEWTAGLPQVRKWLSDVEKYKGEIAAFYKALADYEQAYLDKNEDATREAADRLSQLLTARISDAQAYNAMGLKFVGQGTIPYTIDITNQQEALQWLKNFATDGEGELEQWAQAFPKITDMVKRIKAAEKDGTLGEAELQSLQDAIPQIEALYMKLLNYSDNVGKTIEQQVNAMMPSRAPIGTEEMRQQYQQRRNRTESKWNEQKDKANALGGPVDENGDNASAIDLKQQRDQALIDLEYQFQQQMWQIREQMGTTLFEQYDNELAKYKNMLDKKLISERQFQQKKGQLQMKLGLNVAQQYNDLMSKMITALKDYEIASVEAKYEAEISAAQSAGQDTTALEEQKEAEIFEIRKKYAGMELAVKISEIIASTAAAVMQAFAQLGPIAGAIAGAMISATGTAQVALAIAEYDKVMSASAGSKKTSTAAAANAPKTKLRSGMLTYDEGNADRVVGSHRRKLYDDGSVQVYDRPDAQSSPSGDRSVVYPGTDGHIYRATSQPTLPDGVQLIRKPIATTVNGQPSLVAERGPEIIIGRRATRHIQMNEPGLLHHLAAINGRYRTYDQGTVPAAVPLASPNGATASGASASGEADARVAAALEQNTQMMLAMQQTIAALSQTVTTLQQRGIRSYIQKYGTGGLIDEVKSGLKFDQRYNR